MAVNVSGSTRRGFVERASGVAAAGGVVLGGPTTVVKNDIVVGAYNIVTLASAAASFETTISVPGQIRQSSAADLSGNEYDFFIQPGS